MLEPAQDRVMRGVLLARVELIINRPVFAGDEAEFPESVADDVGRHVACVLQSVDVADLVTVEGRDRDLDDPLPGVNELDDDLGVEVEIVGVTLERD